MSIRNKRLLKEQQRLDNYEIHWPNDWTHHETVKLKTVQKDTYISLEIGMKYPFRFPKMYVHPEFKDGIEYISWFLKLKNKNKHIITNMGINVECVCCDNITCKWAPSYGIANMIEDFIKHYNIYNTLDKFRIIYQKINGFDDLIYKNIMLYLYNAETNS